MARPQENRRLFPVIVAAACVWLALIGFLNRERFLAGVNDFAQLYAGATLVGTPGLYQPEANKRAHRDAIGVEVLSVYYSRPPFYALLLKPLASLPYLAAYWLFQSVSLACIGWFLWTFARRRIEVAVFACIYPPLIITCLNGQDVGIILALASGGYLLMERERPFAAGALWSLCAIKPHLFLFLPVVLLLNGKWRALAGGATGGVALVLLSYLAQGRNWITEYLALLGNGDLHPEPDRMPNLQAMRVAFDSPLPESWLWLPALCAAALAVAAFRRQTDWALAFALSIPASLLVSYHAYSQDTLLMLLALALCLNQSAPPGLVRFAALIATPVAPLILLAGRPWSALYPAFLLVWIAYAALARSARPGQNQTNSTDAAA